MKEAGFERTADQCCEKAKKWKWNTERLKTSTKLQTGRKKGKCLEPLDHVLGNKPTTVTSVIVGTLQESTETEDMAEENLNKLLSDNQLLMN